MATTSLALALAVTVGMIWMLAIAAHQPTFHERCAMDPVGCNRGEPLGRSN